MSWVERGATRHNRSVRQHRRGWVLLLCALGVLVPGWGAAGGTQGQPARAEVVRLAFHRDDGTLTPYTFETGYPLVTLVYDTLMWRDDEGVPQPWLARSVETSPDGRRVTVRLADGARWHDGAAVTAADVAFTFRFVASRFHPRFTPQLEPVARVDTPDPATVVFSLRHPVPGFAHLPLADLPILPAHIWSRLPPTQAAPEGLPLGSGPYRLTEHRQGEAYRFEANREYFRSPPAVATIEVPIIRTPEETLRAIEQSRVDALALSVPEDAVARLRNRGVRVVEGPSYLGTVLMLNLRRPPFDRTEVRQAIARSLDLKRITAIVGKAVAADRGYLHPDSAWAPPERLHVFDRAGAAGLLSRPDVGEIIVAAPNNDRVKLEAAGQVVAALRGAGATSNVASVATEDLVKAVGADGSDPTFHAAIWTAPASASYDPAILYPLFGSDPARARLNYPGYRSPAFDAAATRVGSTPDPEARQAAVVDALRFLAADAPVIPLFFSVGAYAYRPSVFDGWRFVKGTGIVDKRSFVEPLAALPPPMPESGPGPGTQRTEGGWSPLAGGAVAALAAAFILGFVALVRRH